MKTPYVIEDTPEGVRKWGPKPPCAYARLLPKMLRGSVTPTEKRM
jgi:hypothetical protein